jgi:hypothetical protein
MEVAAADLQRDAADIIKDTGVATPATRAISRIGSTGDFEQNADRDLWRLLNKHCSISPVRLLVQREVSCTHAVGCVTVQLMRDCPTLFCLACSSPG